MSLLDSTPSSANRSPDVGADFETERAAIVRARFRLALWIAIFCNPTFLLVDAVATPAQFAALFIMRMGVELGCVMVLALTQTAMGRRYPHVLIVAYYCVLGFGLAHFSLVTGGFASFHYNGVNFVFLANAFFIPANWRVHAVGQSLVLLYYFGLNTVFAQGPVDATNRLHNLLILSWTSIICDYAMYLYEGLMRREFNARRDLEATNRKLVELDRFKNEFFANVSHELRTPLTLIIGAFQRFQKEAIPGGLAPLVSAGLRNSSQLLLLINDLLDLAKSDSGRLPPAKQCIDLAAVVRQVSANFDSSSSHRRIVLDGVEQPVAVEADPRQIKKVIYNLLSNAFKFTDPNAGRVSIRLKVVGERVELAVQDNGIGIPSDQLHRIFDRFYQGEGGTSRPYSGTGIGLALVREIVEHHGGTVHAHSTPGQGSTFTVVLPRGDAERLVVRDAVDEEAETMMMMSRRAAGLTDSDEREAADSVSPPDAPLILVVDDNADLCRYLRQVLAPLYRVATAKDGADGLESAKWLQPDLIITDIMMPRMTGHDLLLAVRRDPVLRPTPVIFLTARAGRDALVESLDVGADDYLSKPFEEGELLARVKSLLRARAQEREIERLHTQLIDAQAQTITKQVRELSTLNRAVEAITSELALDKLLTTVLRLVAENLGFARMLLVLYDSERGMAYGINMVGIPKEFEPTLRDMEIPIRDDGSLRAELLLHGRSFLITDVTSVADRVHPTFLRMAEQIGVKSFVCAPLKSKQRIVGFLTADRGAQVCTESDLDVIVTIAGYVAVAIDNARAYKKLEQFAQHLEQRVLERTEALQAANEQLRELDKLKSTFVSVVSHELRTPITSIKGYVENMLDGLAGTLSERQGLYLSRIKFNLERLTRMINDLLDLSRIEAGRVELTLVQLDASELVIEVVDSLQPVGQAKAVSLEHTHHNGPATICGDRDKLHQILTNLIQNAIKFTPRGGQIRVETKRMPGDFVQFCVSDTGCGISPHEQPKVFERFYRGETTQTDQRGAGLGLAITKSLVEMHGGSIWVESIPDHGSRFYFTIPAATPLK